MEKFEGQMDEVKFCLNDNVYTDLNYEKVKNFANWILNHREPVVIENVLDCNLLTEEKISYSITVLNAVSQIYTGFSYPRANYISVQYRTAKDKVKWTTINTMCNFKDTVEQQRLAVLYSYFAPCPCLNYHMLMLEGIPMYFWDLYRSGAIFPNDISKNVLKKLPHSV